MKVLIVSRGAEGPEREILQRPPSVRPSICPSRLVFAKKHLCIFPYVRAPCHGGGGGGLLYSFWYWWNVVWIFYEFVKYWNFFTFFLSIFHVFFVFMLFATFKNKILVYKNKYNFFFGRGAIYFLEKHFFLISFRILCYFQHYNFIVWKYWKVPLHLLVKWEVVSPNSR